MARTDPAAAAIPLTRTDLRVAIVVAGFHREVADRLLAGARARLAQSGLDDGRIDVRWVPGAYELPLAARTMAGREGVAAVIALGLVVRGQTAHFDYICQAAAHGLSRVGLDTGVPCAFGVLTTEDYAQALARSGGEVGNAGADAADAAVAMINLVGEEG